MEGHRDRVPIRVACRHSLRLLPRGPRNLLVSALIGVALGLVVVVLVLGGIGQLRGWPGWVSGRPGQVLRPPIGLAVLWAGAGLGVLVWGATRGSFQLVLVGLPLIALAFSWYLIKRSLLP